MPNIRDVHFSNSTFIILEEDLDKVRGLCKTFVVNLSLRKVTLTASDLEILR